jgi:hypothetical protein
LFKDQLENANFIGAIGKYQGQSLNGFKILDESAIDGTEQSFKFKLPFAPIKRGNIKLEFYLPDPDGETYEIFDNSRGVFLSHRGYGAIDYKTGDCTLLTKFNYTQVDNMEPIVLPEQPDLTEGRTHFVKTLSEGESINPGSIWLTFTIGEDTNQRTYMVNDIPDSGDPPLFGHFEHSCIKPGKGIINYSTKEIDITFKSYYPVVDAFIKPFLCKYSFPIDYTLPAGTILLASYFFTQQTIPITEAGFRNKDGVLLNYATFPPFEFSSTDYHLNFMILVKKVTSP